VSAAAGTCVAALLGVVPDHAMAAYTAQVQAGTLQITGDRASDKLALVSAPDAVVVDVGEDGTVDFSFDRSAVEAIDVDAGSGDDEVRLTAGGGTFPADVTVNGGNGDDTLRGGPGAEVLLGGGGNDLVDGNGGADIARLGAGADTFQWDPGDGSDTVEGEGGKDALQFNGSNAGETIDITPNGSRATLFRNVAGVTMDLGTLEDIRIRALGAADTVNVADLVGTDVGDVHADLSASAGGGDAAVDTVNVAGSSTVDKVSFSSPTPGEALMTGLSTDVDVAGGEATDVLNADTLGGADSIQTQPGLSGPIVAANGGDGIDSARFNGSDDDDTIGFARSGAASVRTFETGSAGLDTTEVENLAILGKGGDDTIAGQNGIPATTSVTLDGGDGRDTLLGGDGDDTLLGGNGDDSVDGNRGSDIAKLGNGDDVFQWDPGDGNDTVDGQAGADRMDFNGSNAPETIDISRDGGRTRLFRNVAAITMDFDTIEDVHVRALGAVDTITVNDLSGTGIASADVDLTSSGGGGDGSADTVIANGTNRRDDVGVTRSGDQVLVDGLPAQTRITGAESALDTLRVNTLNGDDDVFVAPDVSDLITSLVDLGGGER
jgi:hypothetical protein